MITYTRVKINYITPELGDIISLVPEAHLRGYFECNLRDDDPRLKKIMTWLAENGYWMRPAARFMEEKMAYTLRKIREYDNNDFASCEYLDLSVCSRNAFVEGSDPDRDPESGLILLPCNLVPVSMDVACVDYGGQAGSEIVVTNRVKELIDVEGRGLSHLIVRPTITRPPVRKQFVLDRSEKFHTFKQAQREPWWELESDITLPPVSPRMDLRGKSGGDVSTRIRPGDKKTFVFRVEQPYNRAEIHYRRSDVKKFPKFDAARTYEQWAAHKRGSLIVSQNFYQWWFAQGLNTKDVFVPVRIDEDL